MYRWSRYNLMNQHIKLFNILNYKINTEWYKFFTLIRQKENPLYLPEDIWHLRIEPVLNNKAYNKAFNDKNLYDFKNYGVLFPKTYIHIIEGICYSPNYNFITDSEANNLLNRCNQFVAKKAIDSGGGKGVSFYDNKDQSIDVDKLKLNHGDNVIVQKIVKQHAWFEQFNKESINTIRVVTYRSVKDEKLHVLQMLLRMGKPGSKVDNQSSGGIAVGISSEGYLNSWGFDKLSNKYIELNGITFSKLDKVPNFEELKNTCIDIARTRLYERILILIHGKILWEILDSWKLII